MARHNLIGLFESRKGHLDYRLKRDYVKNGIATIPCRVSTYIVASYLEKRDFGNRHLTTMSFNRSSFLIKYDEGGAV